MINSCSFYAGNNVKVVKDDTICNLFLDIYTIKLQWAVTGSGKKENPVTIVVSGSNRMGLFQETQKLQSAWIGCVKNGDKF